MRKAPEPHREEKANDLALCPNCRERCDQRTDCNNKNTSTTDRQLFAHCAVVSPNADPSPMY